MPRKRPRPAAIIKRTRSQTAAAKQDRHDTDEGELAIERSPADHRNSAMDALRGLAIVLMLIDHMMAMWWEMPIESTNIRFITRLSMPLFAVLLGYYLPAEDRARKKCPVPFARNSPFGRFAQKVPDTFFTLTFFTLSAERTFRWRRWGQILIAGLLVNLLYWPANHELEILASLLCAAIAGTLLGRWTPILAASFLFYAEDPTAAWLDYQLTLVLPLVAVGATLRRFGAVASILLSAILLAMTVSGRWIFVTDTHRFVVWMLPLANALLIAAVRYPDWGQLRGGLAWLGRVPLTIYVTHYYFFTLAQWAFTSARML